MMRVVVLALFLTAVAGQAAPQSRPANSTITVERALTISTVRPLSFGPSRIDDSVVTPADPTQAVIQVTGDPGRIYRVRLPAMITTSMPGATISGFTIRSDNSGDISETLTARMDDLGQDRLHIGGSLNRSSTIVLTEVITASPLSVDYE